MLTALPAAAPSYLLTAMPQSSSTAAMESLGQMTCVPALSPPETERACSRCKHQHPQGYGWLPSLQPSAGCRTDEVWRQLERQHQHVCQLPESLLQRYANDNRSVYKEHVLPTPRTVAALVAAVRPVLVLLREPQAALHGWCEKKHHERCSSTTARAVACKPVDVSEARERLQGLEAFDAGWRDAAARHPGRFTLLTYEAMQASGDRGGALTAALATTWPQLPQCASFRDSTARLLNASTPFCSRLVEDTERSLHGPSLAAAPEAGSRHAGMHVGRELSREGSYGSRACGPLGPVTGNR